MNLICDELYVAMDVTLLNVDTSFSCRISPGTEWPAASQGDSVGCLSADSISPPTFQSSPVASHAPSTDRVTSVDTAATLSASPVVVPSSSPCPAGPETARHASIGDGGNVQSYPIRCYNNRSFILTKQ